MISSMPCGLRAKRSGSVPERTAHGSTIRDALTDAAQRLGAAGLPRPRREATMLWAAVAGGGTKPGDVWRGAGRGLGGRGWWRTLGPGVAALRWRWLSKGGSNG